LNLSAQRPTGYPIGRLLYINQSHQGGKIMSVTIVSVLFSLGYAAGAAFLVWDGWHDGIWTGVVGFLIALICLTLHFQHLDKFGEDEPDELNKL
jgi:hypothetical protein